MFVKLKSAEFKPLKKKTGTFFLCYDSQYGLGLYVLLGKSNFDYYVSYYIDGVKCYYNDISDGIYVDDKSLKRALKLNFYKRAIEEKELENTVYYFDAPAFFNIPDNITTRTLDKKDVQTWYLKSKMVNPLPDIKF